eukprot:sb/3475040/
MMILGCSWTKSRYTRTLFIPSFYKYSRTPIYRDARGKGFCPVNRGARYTEVKYCTVQILYSEKFILPVNRGSGNSGPGVSGSDCSTLITVRKLVVQQLHSVAVDNDGSLAVIVNVQISSLPLGGWTGKVV